MWFFLAMWCAIREKQPIVQVFFFLLDNDVKSSFSDEMALAFFPLLSHAFACAVESVQRQKIVSSADNILQIGAGFVAEISHTHPLLQMVCSSMETTLLTHYGSLGTPE